MPDDAAVRTRELRRRYFGQGFAATMPEPASDMQARRPTGTRRETESVGKRADLACRHPGPNPLQVRASFGERKRVVETRGHARRRAEPPRGETDRGARARFSANLADLTRSDRRGADRTCRGSNGSGTPAGASRDHHTTMTPWRTVTAKLAAIIGPEMKKAVHASNRNAHGPGVSDLLLAIRPSAVRAESCLSRSHPSACTDAAPRERRPYRRPSGNAR
jgi:hypothetical protein